jgi:hypothetical protein
VHIAISGAYQVPGKEWKVIRGIEFTHCREAILRGLTWGELRHDVEKGLWGIIQNQSVDTVKHLGYKNKLYYNFKFD